LDIRFTNIKTLLESLKKDRDIDIQNLNWIEPIGIALLKLHKVTNPNININLTGKKSCINYLKTLLSSQQNQNNTYTPLVQFKNGENIDLITEDISKKILISIKTMDITDKEDLKKYLNYLISEIMDNVISHSQSNIGGFISAQYYPKLNKVQVVIIDNGIGLLQGLSAQHNIKNEQIAIQKAMEKEVTGSNKFSAYNNIQKHAGLGLFFLSKIIEHTKGKLIIVSNNSLYNSTVNEYTNLDTSFQGTLVAFELYEKQLEYEFHMLHNIIRDEDNEDEDEDVF